MSLASQMLHTKRTTTPTRKPTYLCIHSTILGGHHHPSHPRPLGLVEPSRQVEARKTMLAVGLVARSILIH